jgi:hypothetical protein
MRRLTLLLAAFLTLVAGSVSAQCLPPACVNNIVGKILMLESGPPGLQLRAEVAVDGTIDPATASLHWNFDPDYLFEDATQAPGTPPIPFTPNAAAAAAMTYRISTELGASVISRTVILPANVTCSQALLECWTGPLINSIPNLNTGGTFTLRLSWEHLPQFHESTWSDPVTFTVTGGVPVPVPVNCVLSDWIAWGPWLPRDPQVIPPELARIRTREILTPASNGGTCLGALIEMETMPLVPVPIPTFCRYVKSGSTVVQTVAAGTLIQGTNQLATQGTRLAILVSWGFELNATKCLAAVNGLCQTVHVEATCRGLP